MAGRRISRVLRGTHLIRFPLDRPRLGLVGLAARVAVVLACIVLAAFGASCSRERSAPAEAIRLIAPPLGTLAPTYTLGDETRPILASPPELRLQLTVPSGAQDRFTFPVSDATFRGEVVASGVYDRYKRVFALPPQLVPVGTDTAGNGSATLELPALTRGPGPPSQLTLVLTRPPESAAAETESPPLDVPRGARLHFAYGLTEAAALPGTAPVSFEVLAREAPAAAAGGAPRASAGATGGNDASAGTRKPERSLWSSVEHVQLAQLARWHEVTVELDAFAGRRIVLVFRAHAVGEGRPIVVPVWGDPTITAPAPRPEKRRNIVLISIDTLRADRVGVYGAYRPTTPTIDALAAKSVVFEDAWSVWPETSGSHMSLFTSRYPSEHGVTSFISAPAASLELLAERLRRGGYLTRAYTEDGGVWALAGFARGFSAYAERRSPDFVYRGEAAATFADATHWIEANADRTFFLFIHTYQVHAPYNPPKDYRALFADVPGREGGMWLQALAYDQEVRYTDDQVAGFLAALTRLGLAERSIVVLTSDHGEEFGEHGGTGHGRTLHRETLHVPLIVSAPGLLGARRVATPVSLLDVAPTLLDLVGVAGIDGARGTSLAATAAGNGNAGPAADRPLFGEVDRFDRQPIKLVSVRRAGRTAILDLTNGTVRCYEAQDRGETQPAASCPDLESLIAEHRRTATPVGTQAPSTVDPRLVEKMRALGYVQ
jgi:arylsulfatase A-like enzyme